MDEKNKIIANFKKQISEIKKHNKFYYTNDNPIISDAKYDELKRNLLEQEKKFPFLKKIDSVSKLVGAKPSNKFKKIKHLKPMLSLSNTFDKNGIKIF